MEMILAVLVTGVFVYFSKFILESSVELVGSVWVWGSVFLLLFAC